MGSFETDPPLIVDADTVLAFAVAKQSLEAIPGQSRQISEGSCGLATAKLKARGAFKPGEPFDPVASGEVSGPVVAVADDH